MLQTTQRQISQTGAWLTLAAMVATMLYAIVDRQVFSLVAAAMSETLGLSNTELGLIQGLGVATFTLIAAYPIAWLGDRFDRRLVLGSCVFSWAMGTAACGLAAGFPGLFLASALVAAAEAGLTPLFLSLIPELFHGRARITATMIFYIATAMSLALGLFLGGAAIAAIDALRPLPALLEGLEDWRLAFLIAAAPFPLFLLIIALMPFRKAPRKVDSPTPGAAPILPFVKENWRAVVFIMCGLAFFALGLTGLLAWTPISLTRMFGVTPAEIGMTMGPALGASALIGITAGTFLMRRLQAKLGYRAAPRIIWISLIVAAPFLCLIPFATSPAQVYALISVQVVISTIAGSSMLNLLQDLAPAGLRARVMAIYTMVNTPAIGLGVAGSAAIADFIDAGPRSLYWGGLIVSAPAWILCALLLVLSERPYETTARTNSGLQNPLDAPPSVAPAAH